jgi:hypothetical protein
MDQRPASHNLLPAVTHQQAVAGGHPRVATAQVSNKQATHLTTAATGNPLALMLPANQLTARTITGILTPKAPPTRQVLTPAITSVTVMVMPTMIGRPKQGDGEAMKEEAGRTGSGKMIAGIQIVMMITVTGTTGIMTVGKQQKFFFNPRHPGDFF